MSLILFPSQQIVAFNKMFESFLDNKHTVTFRPQFKIDIVSYR